MTISKHWSKLGKKRQNEILILVVFATIALYLLAWHWGNYQNLLHEDKMAHRAENRLQNVIRDMPEAPVLQGNITRDIESVKQKLLLLKTDFDQVNSMFMPVDSVQKYQGLRLEISDLANQNNIYLTDIKELRLEGTNVLIDLENNWKRPLIQYSMAPSYDELMGFLKGLDKLSYQVSPVSIDVHAVVSDPSEVVQQQKLSVKLVLAL